MFWLSKRIFHLLLVLVVVSCGPEEFAPKETKTKPTQTDKTRPSQTDLDPDTASEIDLPPIKILSLDGGGIRGVMEAQILSGFEKETGKRTYELFDIIAGTSTGGLIAIIVTTPNKQNNNSLMSAEQIKQFYFDNAKHIFTKSSWLGGFKGPRYDAENLEKLIYNLVGNRHFKTALKPIVISTFDIEAKLGLSLDSDNPLYDNLTIIDVARATSAAPTYFAPKKVNFKPIAKGHTERYLVDGGLYKNNPSVLAYRKAVKLYGKDQIKKRGAILISLGTGIPLEHTHEGKSLMTAGYIDWAPYTIDAIIDGSSNEDHEVLQDIFSSLPSSVYIRIQPPLDNLNFPKIREMDNIDSKNIQQLIVHAENAMNSDEYKAAVSILKKFAPD